MQIQGNGVNYVDSLSSFSVFFNIACMCKNRVVYWPELGMYTLQLESSTI